MNLKRIATNIIILGIVIISGLFAFANIKEMFPENRNILGSLYYVFKLSEHTIEGFQSFDLFIELIRAKFKYDFRFKVLSVFVLFTPFLIFYLFKKKKDSGKLEEILRKYDLIYEVEETKDSKGNIKTKAEKVVPELKIKNPEDTEFEVIGLHHSKEKNLRAYLKGLLDDLKSIEMIKYNDGSLIPSGRPGCFSITLIADSSDLSDIQKIFKEVGYAYVEEEKRDRNGVLIEPEMVYYPELDLSSIEKGESYFIVRKVEKRAERAVSDYLSGFLSKLKEMNLIQISEGIVESTGFPGEFKIQLIDEEYKKKQRIESVLIKARLYMEEKKGNQSVKVFPKITFQDDGDFIMDTTNTLLTRDSITQALEIFSAEYSPIEYSFVTPVGPSSFKIQRTKPADLLFKKGEAISSDYQRWVEKGPIVKMRELFEKEKQFYWYFGTLKDSSLDLKENDIIVSGDNLVHPYLIGTSGSGKTEGLKTVLMSLKNAYMEHVEIYLANGTPSADLDPITKAYSPMGFEAAKPEGSSEHSKLVRLMNILTFADGEAKKRGEIFKATYEKYGVECKKISDFRSITSEVMPEIIIAVDEFAGYSQLMDYEQNYTKVGSAAFILQVGFSQWRKYGIHFILATQEAKAASIPRRLFSNMSGGVVFRIGGADKNYMEGSLSFDFEGRNPVNFVKGEGIFFGGDIKCEKSMATKIPIAMPWIGKDIMVFIDQVGGTIDQNSKIDYDTDLLNLSEKDLDFSRISKKNLQQLVEKCFLEREGWTISRKENPNYKIINLYAERDDKKIYIGFAESGDVITDNFDERISRENPEYVDLRVFFISGKVEGDRLSKIKDKIETGGEVPSLVLIQSDYDMALKEAHELYQDKSESRKDVRVFDILLDSAETRNKERAKKDIDGLYRTNFSKNSINLNQLNKIREQEDSAKKGSSFEDYFLTMEREAGFDTVHGKELSLNGFVNMKFANPQADGGLDAFRFTSREKKTGIGFQLKNQMSKPLDISIVDKMMKTKRLYEAEGMTFEKFILITTGRVTSQAQMEADKLGFIVIDGNKLDRLIIGKTVDDNRLPRFINPINGESVNSTPQVGLMQSFESTAEKDIVEKIKFPEVKNELANTTNTEKTVERIIEEPKKIDLTKYNESRLKLIEKLSEKMIMDRTKSRESVDEIVNELKITERRAQKKRELSPKETISVDTQNSNSTVKDETTVEQKSVTEIEEVSFSENNTITRDNIEVTQSEELVTTSAGEKTKPQQMRNEYTLKVLEKFKSIDDRYTLAKDLFVPATDKRTFLVGASIIRIVDEKIDVVYVRFNNARPCGTELLKDLKNSIKILKNLGYTIGNKTIVVSGKASKELQNSDDIKVYHVDEPFI